ncbi:MAG TPA: hypothetical protein VE973_03035 [Candidatus Limnocylindria bacterium]|nr:hypothetical protein [Candidatus Limnocylindria bacterium]
MQIRYKQTTEGWGLTGFIEGTGLIFSGEFTRRRLGKEKLQKILPFLKGGANYSQRNIIKSIDLYSLFTPEAKLAWNKAYSLAKKQHRDVTAEDIFVALLQTQEIKNLFKRLKLNEKLTGEFLENYPKNKVSKKDEDIKKLPFESFLEAAKLHCPGISPLILFYSLLKNLKDESIVHTIFANTSLSLEGLEVFIVWALKLDYDFERDSYGAKILFCCRQTDAMEEHFGYFFTFPAIEKAVKLSSELTFQDLQHTKAMQLLVKAAGEARNKNSKIISENFVNIS